MRTAVVAVLSIVTLRPALQAGNATPPSLQDVPAAANLSKQLSGLPLDPALIAQIDLALQQRDYPSAEKILVTEAARDPQSKRSAQLLEMAGGIFFQNGQYMNAVIAWKKAEAIAPLDDRNRFTLAMACIKLDKRAWARPELEKLAAQNPQDTLYSYWLARLDYDAHDYNRAIDRLKALIARDPKMARAYDTLGLCYDYLGKFDDAVANFQQAIELDRQQARPSPWPRVDLANSLISLNRLAEAEQNLRAAIAEDPKLAQAHYQLGRVLEMQSRYQESLASLKEAVALAPAYPDPHYLLGRIYHRLGDEPQSKAEIARFQELKTAADRPAAQQAPAPPPPP